MIGTAVNFLSYMAAIAVVLAFYPIAITVSFVLVFLLFDNMREKIEAIQTVHMFLVQLIAELWRKGTGQI